MKKIYFSLVIVMFTIICHAQTKTPHISFDKTSHDFGTITQEDGLATVVFNFTNTGSEPVVISEVKSSCGCTSPDYSKEPVAPGDVGFVSAAYNPVNRPGSFSKSLTVVSNADNNSITLKISGEVTEKQPTVEEIYPQQIGDIRLDKIFTNFSNTFNNEIKSDTIKIINNGNEEIEVTINETQLPEYLTISIVPTTLKPEEKGTIVITIDGSKANDWDYIRSFVYLYFNGEMNTTGKISATAIIKENFSEEDLAKAPVIEFESTDFNFESIAQGESVQHTFVFKNTGKSDLLIRKTRASCGCTAVNTSEEAIAPGETGTIKATFNSSGKSGNQNKIITIITNDPTQDKIILKITGYVTTE